MKANAKVQPDAERNLIVKERKALSVKPRNDADSGRIAAHEMRCDGTGWSNDVETDYGRVQIFMTEDILGFDTFRILRRWPSILIC
jgi:hypothetical protein